MLTGPRTRRSALSAKATSSPPSHFCSLSATAKARSGKGEKGGFLEIKPDDEGEYAAFGAEIDGRQGTSINAQVTLSIGKLPGSRRGMATVGRSRS